MKKYFIFTAMIVVVIICWYMLSVKKSDNSSLKRAIFVGVNAEYPPFAFVENNTIIGFDIDVITALSKQLGKDIEISNMPWTSLIPQLQVGNIDIVMGVKPTKERAQRVLFTQPYFKGDQLVIITRQKDPQPQTVNDLAGKAVAVNEGFTADMYMSEIAGVELQRLSTVTEGLMALKTGRVYAYVSAQSSVQEYFRQYSTQDFTITPIPDTDDQNAIAVYKNHSSLRDQLQAAISLMFTDGTLNQLRKKWNLS